MPKNMVFEVYWQVDLSFRYHEPVTDHTRLNEVMSLFLESYLRMANGELTRKNGFSDLLSTMNPINQHKPSILYKCFLYNEYFVPT